MSPERIFTGPIAVRGDPRQAVDARRGGPAPLFLLADSQLLFRTGNDAALMDRVAACTGPGAPRAAYLGASNGDDPDFYSVFLAAMEALGPAECRMIPAVPSDDALAFLAAADVIVLAGGEVQLGWRAFQASGIGEIVERRRGEGAVLIGVSAGAVQMGAAGWTEDAPESAFPTWGMVPFVVDAHAEDSDWADLRAVLHARGEGARGIGIPRGGALVFEPDGTVEAVRHPLTELRVEGGELVRAAILPPAGVKG